MKKYCSNSSRLCLGYLDNKCKDCKMYTNKEFNGWVYGTKALRRLFLNNRLDVWPVKWGNYYDIPFRKELIPTGARTLDAYTIDYWINLVRKIKDGDTAVAPSGNEQRNSNHQFKI